MTWERLGVLTKLGWSLIRLRLLANNDSHTQSRRLLFDNFKDLGGVYVKFLQTLALNVDFLKGWAGTKEFEIFEAVPFESIDILTLLHREIPDFKQQFRFISPTPFAAGSFAQVYRAELTDGTSVVLKVLRPSLARNLEADLRLIGFVTLISSWLHPNSLINVRQLQRQFAQTVRAETDYQQEVHNAQWFYEYFRTHDDVHIPKTFAELSSAHIIVQEFMDGISLADVLTARQRGVDPAAIVWEQLGSNLWSQLETVGAELLGTMLVADLVIGDPHPGNIKLLPDNKIGLIDFGIAAPAPANRQAFLHLICEYRKFYAEQFNPGEFTLAMLQFFDEDLIQALSTAGKLLTPNQPNAFLARIGQSANETLEATRYDSHTQMFMQQKMMIRLFNRSINGHNRLGVRINLDSAMMIKAATTYLAMVRSMGVHDENYVIVHRAMDRAIAMADSQSLPPESAKPVLGTTQALEFLSGWLSRLADADPLLYQQITASMTT